MNIKELQNLTVKQLQKKATDLIDLITQKRIKEILGKINFEKYINEKI